MIDSARTPHDLPSAALFHYFNLYNQRELFSRALGEGNLSTFEKRLAIGKIVKSRRKYLRMSQLQLAKEFGLDNPQFVSLCERGLSEWPVSYYSRLSRVLGIKLNLLVTTNLKFYKKELREKIEGKNGKA